MQKITPIFSHIILPGFHCLLPNIVLEYIGVELLGYVYKTPCG